MSEMFKGQTKIKIWLNKVLQKQFLLKTTVLDTLSMFI